MRRWVLLPGQSLKKPLHFSGKLNYGVFRGEFGWVAVAGSGCGLSRIILFQPDREKALAGLGIPPQAVENLPFFGELIFRLQGYFKGKRVNFPDVLDLSSATTFEQAVWEATRLIPYGETRTYGWVAEEIGLPHATRAVGQALARNPFPIVVPCHRVVGSCGSLVGFSAGLKVKRKLLALEAR